MGFKLHYGDPWMGRLNPLNLERERLLTGVSTHSDLAGRIQEKMEFVAREYDLEQLESRFLRLWDHMQADENLHVVHVKRWNLLKRLLSLRLAYETNVWAKTSAGAPTETHPPIRLEHSDCLQYFQTADQEQHHYEGLFSRQPRLDIVYEQFFQDTSAGLLSVQRFLGLSKPVSHPGMHKQGGRHLDDAIENYGELKEQFTGSKWEDFFK